MGKPVRILDLARNMIRLSGYEPETEIPIEYLGVRPGEKLDEELVSDDEETRPTSVPKIQTILGREGSSPPPRDGDLRRLLDELEAAAATGDVERLRDVMGLACPTVVKGA